MRRPPDRRRLGEHVERLERDRPVGVGVVVDVDPVDVGLALVPLEAVDVVLDRLVDVDRPLVDEDLGAEQVHLAEDPRAVRRGVDDHDVLRGGRPQRDLRRREVLAGPVPAAVAGLADVPLLGEERQQVVRGCRPEPLARLERQLERRGPQVGEEDVEVVRVQAGLLRRALEEELGVVDDVLVDRCARGDEHRDARPLAPAGPPELLPRRRDGARIAGQDRHVQATDVDAQLERVRGDDPEDLAVAQAMLDRAPFRRQVAAPVAADPAAGPEALAQRLAQPGQQDLDRDARAAEDDRLAPGPQERQGPALGERRGRAAGATLRVEDRWIDEDHVALAGRRAVPVDEGRRSPGQHLRQLGRVADGRRAAHDDRVAAVVGADPQQPAQDVGDVAAEHAAVRVELVDDDVARSCSNSWNHLVWWGRIAEWSMSGLVTTTWPAARIAERIGAGVSPS